MKKIVINFLGNMYYDTRTFNLYNSLEVKGHGVKFIGFDWLTPEFKTIKKKNISITKLSKTRFSIFFYLQFFFSQLHSCLTTKADIYFASDFFSLPACVITAKIRRAKVFYDSREIYTELPFHDEKPVLKKMFKILEKYLIKSVDRIFTTGEMDSQYLKKIYPVKETFLLRNFPLTKTDIIPIDFHNKFNIPDDSITILYQGIIVKGRGIDTYYKAVQKMVNLYLIILGGGEHLKFYNALANEMKISDRVIFAGKISQDEILNYTAGAFAGLSIIDNISVNNYYALPNKLFEYVMSGLPVIVNDLPQMQKVVNDHDIGEVIKNTNEDELISVLKNWNENRDLYKTKKENCKKASLELNWEKEFSNVYHLFE